MYNVTVMVTPPIAGTTQRVIDTVRLRLRHWQTADLPFVDSILGDVDVMAFSDRGPLNAEDQAAWLQKARVRNAGQVLGTLAIERKP